MCGSRRFLSLLFSLCILVLSADVLADPQANHWLKRMNQAVSELDYDGHFVYLRGGMLDAMKIRHRIKDGNTRQYIVSLTGTPREVIRDKNRITIIQSRNGKMHISQRSTAGKIAPLSSLKPEELDANYRLIMGEDVRVAGRLAKEILLQPKDDLRYGCRLFLDQTNALPLGVTLFDKEEKQVSRIMFTDLQILYPAEEGEVADDLIGDSSNPIISKVIESVTEQAEAADHTDSVDTSEWHFESLPAGYQLKNYHLRNGNESAERMEHFVFTDGLATVSVYVEPIAESALRGEANLGAVNALGAQVAGHQLTIVGEVPVTTLKMLLDGARLNAG